MKNLNFEIGYIGMVLNHTVTVIGYVIIPGKSSGRYIVKYGQWDMVRVYHPRTVK